MITSFNYVDNQEFVTGYCKALWDGFITSNKYGGDGLELDQLILTTRKVKYEENGGSILQVIDLSTNTLYGDEINSVAKYISGFKKYIQTHIDNCTVVFEICRTIKL